jgi:hypothetical protein
MFHVIFKATCLVLFLASPAVATTLLADEVVECEGYDSDTGAYVYGECVDGDFEGYDSDTGEYVYGDCEPDGDLEAYNSETGEYVYGECEEE